MNQDPNKSIKQKLIIIPILAMSFVAIITAFVISLILMYEANQHIILLEHIINDQILLTKLTTSLKAIESSLYKNIAIATILIISIFSAILIPVIKKQFIQRLDNVQNGLFNFFDFLDGKTKKVKYIEKNTGAISDTINARMKSITDNLRDDKEFIEDFIKTVDKVKHGDYTYTINKIPNNKILKQAYTGTNEMLKALKEDIGTDLNKILYIIEHYAKEDYTQSISNPLGKVELSINKLRDVIVHMLHENRQNSTVIKERAKSVNENISTVYTNIEEKLKNSFDEILTSVNEITHHIKSNVESASYMASFSHSVNDAAQDGQSLANQTTQAMHEIKEKVQSINSAISIIDKITMQTNILSLNAAVEASTAGDYGKGFAVVAQEVRKLASQTATASEDIKHIVESAMKEADNGAQIATKMINGYNELVTQVEKTIDLVYSITQNSNNQDKNIQMIHKKLSALSHIIKESNQALFRAKELSNQNYLGAQKSLEKIEYKQFA